MEKYLVISYNDRDNTHYLKNIKTGSYIRADLCVDASWKEYLDLGETNNTEVESLCNSIVGKKIEIEEVVPCIYFAKNTKLI